MANIVLDFLHNYQTGERRESEPANAYQYDEGHVLEAVVPVAVTSCEIQYWIRGMEKADAYTPTSITQNTDNTYTILGNIPNSYFETNGDLRVYIVVTDGDASITTYEGYIHIKERQMPEDYVDDDPENEAVRVIAEAQAAAATATQKASDAAASADQAQEILDSIPEDYTQLTEDVSNLKDDFHSYHSELGAGYADQLVSSIESEDSVPYNFRKVPYDATLEKVEGIVGVDVVLNQLITFAAGSYTTQGITVTKGNDGSMTFDGTATGNIYTDFYSNFQNVLTANHKYLFLFENPTGNATLVNSFGSPSITTKSGRIVPYAESQKVFLSVFIENGKTCDNEKVYPMVFDLTKTFGSQIADYAYSLEQSTAGSGVAWLKANFPKIFNAGYVPYNAGTLVHVSGLSAKKTVGFNQWDEELEVGGYNVNTGEKSTDNSRMRSKNLIPVLSGQQYYFNLHYEVGSFGFYMFRYDANKNYLGYAVNYNVLQTIPDDTRYINFVTQPTYGTTYNHDICINLSDPAKNGTYEPYTEHTYPLDSTIDLHGILKLDSNNNLYADGDVYKADGTVTRNYTKRAYQSGDESLANAITDGTNTVVKLSTPTTETAEPYNPNQICDPNGTEEYISETVAPVGNVTKYPLDIAGRLDNILTMPSANGTYVLRATVNNGKVTYSWVSA